MSKFILGIDQSLTSTGICIFNHIPLVYFSIQTSPKSEKGIRLKKIVDIILICSENWGINLAVMEGYSYHSIGKTFDLGEVGGVIKYELSKNDIPYASDLLGIKYTSVSLKAVIFFLS